MGIGYNVGLMNNIRHNITVKVISLILIIGIFWQTSGWTDSGIFVKNTLQGRTLFTNPELMDSSASLVTKYLDVYFGGIEDDPRNRNTARLKCIVREKLCQLSNNSDISEKLGKIIPDFKEIRTDFGFVEFDLGSCTIRYFNPSVSDAAEINAKVSGIREIVKKKPGRYLTKLIFVRREIPVSDKGGNEIGLQQELTLKQTEKRKIFRTYIYPHLKGIEDEILSKDLLLVKEKAHLAVEGLRFNKHVSRGIKNTIEESKIYLRDNSLMIDLGEYLAVYSNDISLDENVVLAKGKSSYMKIAVFTGKHLKRCEFIRIKKEYTEKDRSFEAFNNDGNDEIFKRALRCYKEVGKCLRSKNVSRVRKLCEKGIKILNRIPQKTEKVKKLSEGFYRILEKIESFSPKYKSFGDFCPRPLRTRRKAELLRMKAEAGYEYPDSFGPALFVDPDTGELRELRDEPNESGGITEHKAVNEALEEMVFKSRYKPLETGNPVYDFMQGGFHEKISMHKYDSEELKEKLYKKGYPRLAEGLITHAGTYRDEDTGETRAYNIFIPDFVYELLLELLKRKANQGRAGDLLDFWKLHELSHLSNRNHLEINYTLKKKAAKIAEEILILAKALQALKKKEFAQAEGYINKVVDIDENFAFPFEIIGRIGEACKNWHQAYAGYLSALTNVNAGYRGIIHGHPLEEKVLDMLTGNKPIESFLKRIKSIRDKRVKGLSSNCIVAQCEFLEKISSGEIKSRSDIYCKVNSNKLHEALRLGVMPVMCIYLVRALKYKPRIDSFEEEIVEKLLKTVLERRTDNLDGDTSNDSILGRVYYLAGEMKSRQGRFSEAFEYFEKAIDIKNDFPLLYAKKAFALVKRDQTLESVIEAENILRNAEKRFNEDNLFMTAKRSILEEKEKINAEKKRKGKLKEAYCGAIAFFERGEYQKCMDLLCKIVRETDKMDFHQDLVALKVKTHLIIKLKRRVLSCFKEKSYEEAAEVCLQILEKNPYDAKIIQFYGTLFDIMENERREKIRLTKLQTCLTQAKILCENGDGQIISGRIERARRNYAKAIDVLSEVPNSDEIQSFIEGIKEKLAKITDLPNVVERHQPKPKKTAKKKKDRKNVSDKEGKDKEISLENAKTPVFRMQELKICLSDQVAEVLREIDRKYTDAILKKIKQTADKKVNNVKKIETSDDLYRISKSDYCVIYTILEGAVMLVCEIEKKKNTKYGIITKRLSDPNTRWRLLEKSITIKEFEKCFENSKKKSVKTKRRAMKVPRSLSLKENEEPLESAVKAIYSKFGKSDSIPGRGKSRKCISLLALPSAEELREKIREHMLGEVGQKAEILSVGVGTGIFEEKFINEGCTVTGIDIASEPLKLAEQRGVNTVNIDANKPDFWDDAKNKQKFNAVFVCESIGYFENDKIFERIKQVLKPGGKVYILTSPGSEKKQFGYKEFNYDDTIEWLKICGFEKIIEKNFLHWAGSVRLISAELGEGNEKNNDVADFQKPLWNAKKIEKNAKDIAPCFVQGAIDAAECVSEKDEKAMLYIDEVFTETGENDLSKAMKGFLRVLIHIEGNNDELSLFFKNKLEIRSGSKEEFVSKKGKIKPENIIVVTNKDNFESGCFSSIAGSGIITAIDDAGFSEKVYSPLLGAALFAIGKYLEWDEETLSKFYEKIPNAVSIEDLSDEEYASLFGKDSKTMIINLIPGAAEFETEEHVKIIECVRDILSKA